MEETIEAAYLRLLYISKFPEAKLGRLLAEYGSLTAVKSAVENSTIAGINRFEREALRDLGAHPSPSNPLLDQTYRWVEGSDNHLLSFDSPNYPSLLKHIHCPPPLLYVTGDPLALQSACCAMVGSRKASQYGLRVAGWLANELASLGLTIVSGMALGIDSRSHEMALSAGGTTVAAVGCGVDVLYPKQNAKLKDEIRLSGALISEYPLGTQPRPHHFPRRNRIISGISLGLIVVEAAERSGSLITARQAMEQGRDVFAVPGQIGTRHSKGSHKLIKEGAKLIECAADVTESILNGWHHDQEPSFYQREQPDPSSNSETVGLNGRVLEAITEPDCLLQNIVERADLSIAEVQCALLELEISGLVEIQGGRASRNL